MKYIISKEQYKRLKELIEKFLVSKKIPGTCGFWVDAETEPDSAIWIYITFDSEFLEGTNLPITFTNTTASYVKSEIESVFGVKVLVGTLVKKCSSIK